ncbi:MAG: glycogen-binding domain-containing protein [Bacteroidetes bacterium]|nr:glycogen-binding domain-containing protein [Bacteroidota bacterium]
MKKIQLIIPLLLLFSLFAGNLKLYSQARIHNGWFELQVNLNISKTEQLEFGQQYNLDTLIIKRLFDEDFRFINDSTEWKLEAIKPGLVLLAKKLSAKSPEPPPPLSEIILSELYTSADYFPVIQDVAYGVNNLSNHRSFRMIENKACFMLTAFENANKVILSGSFNNWNTMEHSMQKTDSGWVSCLSLEAGKYSYKYIVDGRWMADPGNLTAEANEQGTTNSVVFVYNHQFDLKAHKAASSVFLAGTFNNWRPDELKLSRTDDGWKLPLYLREGTHAYKYIVDGQWINDPENPDQRPDGRGNLNSFIGIGDELLFVLNGFKSAENVILTGDFNAWNEHELTMNRTDSGWELAYTLAPGNYEYKYIVDGRWILDPHNPYSTGSGDFENSFIAFQPNHVFALNGFVSAKEVLISGSFNDWNENGYHMLRKKNNWVFPIFLKPGRYSYKFIVDRQWITDPDNPYYEKNEFGSDNSVLWINP